MIRIAAAALLLLTSCTSGAAKGGGDAEHHAAKPRDALVGKPAPAATLHMLDGAPVRLDELIGRKPIYLKFWATWCVPCRKQTPHLEAAHRKYGDRIAVVAVDLGLNDSVEAVRQFQAEHAMTVPIAIDDGDLAERFHVAVTPQHILVDRAGIIRYVGHGATEELDRALESLLADDAKPAARPRPAEPQAAAPPPLTLLDGSTFALSGQAGRPTALTFVLASCDWYLAKSRPTMAVNCAKHARQIESLGKTSPDITWVTVAHPVWTSTEDLEEYRKRLGVSPRIGLDDTAAWFHHFRVRDVTTTILLDGNGAEVARVGGPGDDLPRALTLLRPGEPAR